MFHSIEISLQDQMTRLFLWRDLQLNREPLTYAMMAVNFGEHPSATIAQAALLGTAQMEIKDHKEACNITIVTWTIY